MERDKNFRLKLNLFDTIVLVLALAAIVLMLWYNRRMSDPTRYDYGTEIQYTVRLANVLEGVSSRIKPGDVLIDAIRNGGMGTVVDVTSSPCRTYVLDEEKRAYIMAELDGYEDVEITIAADVSVGEGTITIGEGTSLRVGLMAYLRGPGYMGSGPIVAINRKGTEDWGKNK